MQLTLEAVREAPLISVVSSFLPRFPEFALIATLLLYSRLLINALNKMNTKTRQTAN